MALGKDGRVVTWGDTNWAFSRWAISVPAGVSNVTAIASGSFHCLALKRDDTVAAWEAGLKNNQFAYELGQCVVPSEASNIVAIAAGGTHSIALNPSGNVFAWGNDYYRETEIPAGLGQVRAIAAGNSQSLALLQDGSVRAWGLFAKERAPENLRKVKAIGAGVDFFVAVVE